jgi:hypothetical protein
MNVITEAYKLMSCTQEVDFNLGSSFVDGSLTVTFLLQVANVFQLLFEVQSYLVTAS